MSDFVTHAECENYRDEIEKKLMDNSMKIVELEATLKSLVNTNRMILTSVIGGIASILVVLLTRGI